MITNCELAVHRIRQPIRIASDVIETVAAAAQGNCARAGIRDTDFAERFFPPSRFPRLVSNRHSSSELTSSGAGAEVTVRYYTGGASGLANIGSLSRTMVK